MILRQVFENGAHCLRFSIALTILHVLKFQNFLGIITVVRDTLLLKVKTLPDKTTFHYRASMTCFGSIYQTQRDLVSAKKFTILY